MSGTTKPGLWVMEGKWSKRVEVDSPLRLQATPAAPLPTMALFGCAPTSRTHVATNKVGQVSVDASSGIPVTGSRWVSAGPGQPTGAAQRRGPHLDSRRPV